MIENEEIKCVGDMRGGGVMEEDFPYFILV